MSVVATVVIPAYNAAQYLAETIESVLSQTFTDFEVLIIDDGSTDNTAEIARFYTQRDQRLKYFLQSNQGVAAARNQGIELAKGELIAFLDADDQWLSDKLAVHVQHFELFPDLGMSFGRVEFMTSEGKPTGTISSSRLNQIEPKHLYFENLIVTPSNAVIRRIALEQVGDFNRDRDLMGMEDAELFVRLICKGWKIEGIDQILVRYRTAQTGVSSNLARMEQHWEKFSDEVRNYAPELVQQHYQRAKAYFLRYLARRSIRLGLPPKIGMNYMARSWQSDWQLVLQEPRRTLSTWLLVCAQRLISGE